SIRYSTRTAPAASPQGNLANRGGTLVCPPLYTSAHNHQGQPCPVRILPILPTTLPQPRGMRESWKAELGFLAIAAFWNGCLSVFIWMTWIAPWRAKQLVKWGEPVPGTILSKHEIRGKGTSYKISYYFTARISHAADGFEIYARSLSGSMDVSR